MQQRVLIAGGGMVGLAFAVALAHHSKGAVALELIEGRPLPNGDPDPLDSRASALNLRSRDLLSAYGVWPSLVSDAAPIRDIHVSNQQRFGSAELHAQELGDTALGYVAENHVIGRALLETARRSGVLLRAPERIVDLAPRHEGPGIVLADGAVDAADLVILADGGASALRTALGIGVDVLDTGQTAVVGNVVFEGVQRGVAFERFTASGPLALLPLPDRHRGQARFNLVWSMTPEAAESRAEQPPSDFLAALQEAFGWRLGRLVDVGRRSVWPLARVRAQEQSRPGYLVAGNAAHALHPVAGQGFNLSLRDADAYARVAAAALRQGLSLGSRRTLRDYEAQVSDDQALTLGATDTLATLFNHRGPLLDIPRDAALSLLDLSAAARRGVAALGAGVQYRGGTR